MASKEDELICAVALKNTDSWGEAKKKFYYETLNDLSSSLKKLGQNLFIVNNANHLIFFDKVIYTKIYNSKEIPFLENFEGQKIAIDQTTLFKETELPFEVKNLKKTFTPFRHQMDKVKKTPIEPFKVKKLPKPFEVELEQYKTQEISARNTPYKGGEKVGLERLRYYFSKPELPKSYFETRNGLIDFDDSTKFSPWLAWGCLSPERIFFELRKFENNHGDNKSTYWIFFELLWRDYFKFLSLQKGDKIFKVTGTSGRELSFNPKQDKLFDKWRKANTEESFVNANMNELNLMGFMSNRGRQNVASYLAKEYQVNWLWGAQYFDDHLIDADTESNLGNWGYLAGVGVDPRDRKFNIQKQQNMYDPDLEYTKKYSPEGACP